MARRAKKRKIGSVIYGTFIVLYVLALAAVILVVLSRTWAFAKDYEAAQPAPVIDAYMDDLRANLYNDGIGAAVAEMNHGVQSNDEVVAQVKRLLRGTLDYRRAAGSDGESRIVYDLICNKEKFGTVTLVRDDSAGKDANFVVPVFKWSFDLRPWKIGSEEFYLDGLYSSLSITVPSTYSVTVNGVTLGEDHIVERDIPYDVLKDYYDTYPDLPTKVTYSVGDLIGEFEPVVYDEKGNEVTIDENADDMQFIEQPSAEIMAKLTDFVADFSNKYLYFSSGVGSPTGSFASLQPYLIEGGDLENRLRGAMVNYAEGWLNTNSYQFNSSRLNSAIEVDEGYYIVDATAETTVTFPNKGDNGVVHDFNGLKMIVRLNGDEIKVLSVERYSDDDTNS